MNNDLLQTSLGELEELMKTWGYPRFRAQQIFEWIHKHHVADINDMSNVPTALKKQLKEFFPDNEITLVNQQVSTDGTRKYVLELSDGTMVETVGMPTYHPDGSIDRLTVCVSSQVGCPMACAFCATGREGFTRNLSPAEIVAQIALVQSDFDHRVSNVVVMGQGEPFLNYDNVLKALRIINDPKDFNIGARRITVSTCGILAGIERFSEESEQFTLAISLHSAIQSKRNALMPKVENQPLSKLKKSLSDYCELTNRRVSLEYLLIENVNDSEEDLAALVDFCDGLICHVNLLPMNAIPSSPYQPSPASVSNRWLRVLDQQGIEASMRRSRGADIDGACGQLKNSLS